MNKAYTEDQNLSLSTSRAIEISDQVEYARLKRMIRFFRTKDDLDHVVHKCVELLLETTPLAGSNAFGLDDTADMIHSFSPVEEILNTNFFRWTA